ncbi:polygalacturonase-like [Phalaenopsis equestris]|uniref:polygalacturonase-like n=1 Tax=Phalaenopsis equestris TaxID=78828 RepID=UPI0009E5B8B1|nr:polygalacturonase-like [Phalaenopsis equestris]
MSIMYSQGIRVEGATITAPFNSPNTDGIHIHTTSGASIINSAIGTGDDCISLGTGAINIWIENIRCGPGHGISIGSLGETPSRSAVQNVTVSSVVLTGTENGLRIKTWAKPYNGFVRGVTFQHAIMNNVKNPIIIDQNYCPNHKNCPKQNSGIKISGVVFDDVRGSSATAVAVTLDCSRSNPCSGIELRDVRLSYDGEDKAEAFCRNAVGESSGLVIPPSCI